MGWSTIQFAAMQSSSYDDRCYDVQVRSLSLDWDITFPPPFAKEIGSVYTPPRHLHLPLINAKFKTEVCMKTRQDNPLTKCFLCSGCIVFESRDPNGITPTTNRFLCDIWDYFKTSLTEEEHSSFAGDNLAKVRKMAYSGARILRETQSSHLLFGRRGRRVVMCFWDMPVLMDWKCVRCLLIREICFSILSHCDSRSGPVSQANFHRLPSAHIVYSYSVLSIGSTGTKCLNVMLISTWNGG